jgi:hypothetical protein
LDKILEAIDSLEQEEIILNLIRERIEDIKEEGHRYKKIIEKIDKPLSKTDNFRMDPLDHQEKIKNYDQAREACHNDIISSLCIIKRNLLKVLPQETVSGLVFPLSDDEMRAPEGRREIGSWVRINATREELKNYREKLLSLIPEE